MAQAAGIRLEPGTLAEAVAARARSALREGALLPIPTRAHVVEEQGIPFVVRVLAQLEPKRGATLGDRAAGRNPFLPHEASLFVADLSDTHFCLLNKFNVVDDHLLLVTRRFEEQEDPLGGADFVALWTCLREVDGLGFYNAGPASGASQRHKHLQLVPLPLGPGPAFPLAPRLEDAPAGGPVAAAPGLPFPHALARVEALAGRTAAEAGAATLDLYREMLGRLGVVPGRSSYNLLLTRRRLWLVPREREEWQGISVNALGFAGALLVPDEAALERVREAGPLAVLRAVVPAPGRPTPSGRAGRSGPSARGRRRRAAPV
jgi:ATP adenylyltransferase